VRTGAAGLRYEPQATVEIGQLAGRPRDWRNRRDRQWSGHRAKDRRRSGAPLHRLDRTAGAIVAPRGRSGAPYTAAAASQGRESFSAERIARVAGERLSV